MEYCLPVRISQSVENQLPAPRPPMLRVPTALTSSSLPGLMCGSRALPGDGSESVFASVWDCWAFALALICFFASLEFAGAVAAGGTSEEVTALSVEGVA